MIGEIRHVQLFELPRFHDIANCINRLALLLKLLHVRDNLVPVLRPNDQVYAGDVQNLRRRCLRVTAGHRYNSFRIAAHGTPNNLTALLVAGVRNGTGIN
ncbi:hypothetical protein D3C81_941690 [compost metagenome]